MNEKSTIVRLDTPMSDPPTIVAADRETPDVVVVIESRDEQLQRHEIVVPRRRYGRKDLFEQRRQRLVGSVGGPPHDTAARVGVELIIHDIAVIVSEAKRERLRVGGLSSDNLQCADRDRGRGGQ